MKLTMKKTLLAAALATLALSGTANAAMTTSASGDSSLILSVLDFGTGVSATFDLGFSKSTFNQGADASWNLTSGNYASAWSSFASAANLANTQWSVLALDSGGANSGDQSIFTTVASTWANVTNTTLTNMQRNFDFYINANNGLANHNTVADGGSYTTSATGGNAYAGVSNAFGSGGKIGNSGGDTNTLFGTDMNVWNIVRNGTGVTTNATATKLSVAGFNPYFSMSNSGALTYVSAVPEADNYAMLLAGLGLMGFIARRRMSV